MRAANVSKTSKMPPRHATEMPAAKVASTEMASAEMAPTKVRPAEMCCAKMASAEAAEMASTKMSPTEAAKMASAEASTMTSADPASSKVASASSAPTTSAKRHHTVRHGENTECDACHQRHEGAARDSVWHNDSPIFPRCRSRGSWSGRSMAPRAIF